MELQQLDVGSVIGGFKLEKELGRGGMGVVYKAHELSLNRKVALKILSERLCNDAEFIERFKREAKVVAALSHPNIVSIMSFGEEGGLYYFAMEYVQGTDLGIILKERRQLPLNEALGITAQIADALSEAADKGVVHRDLKPSNIMIDSVGRIKVTDYGIAYFQDAESHLTRTGLYMGTPEYSSPEQASGQKLDIRSDIYSLGAILYKMLSGEVPVSGESPLAVVAKIMTEPVRPIAKVNPSLPKLICQLVDKMMTRDKEKRFQTPAEVINAINFCIDKLQIQPSPAIKVSAPVPPHRPTTVSVQRRRARTIGAVAGVIAAVLLSMWTVDALWNRKAKEETPPVVVEEPAPPAQVATPAVPSAPPVEQPQAVTPQAAAPLAEAVPVAPAPPSAATPGSPAQVAISREPAVSPAPSQEPAETPSAAAPAAPAEEPGTVAPPAPIVKAAPKPRPAEPVKTAKIDTRVRLPETPVVLMIVAGDESLAPFLRVHLENIIRNSGLKVASVAEIPVLRQKMQVGDMPVSWYDIKEIVPPGAAHILLISDVQKTGTMPLQFYGRTETLTNAAVTVRVVDMETGEAAGASGSASAKFTPLNMDQELRKAADTAASGIGQQIRKYWRDKRQATDSSG